MLIHKPNPLRITIVGLCLLVGIASAQAALTVTFEENRDNGVVNVIFSGSEAAPFDIAQPVNDNQSLFASAPGTHAAFVFNASHDDPSYMGTSPGGWATSDRFPFEGRLDTLISSGGSAGFYYIDDGEGATIYLFSANQVYAGFVFDWGAVMTYEGSFEDIGLTAGQSGTITFSNASESFVINWSTTVVPEPSTYALVLGLGVAGVALLRRR